MLFSCGVRRFRRGGCWRCVLEYAFQGPAQLVGDQRLNGAKVAMRGGPVPARGNRASGESGRIGARRSDASHWV